MPGRGRWGPTDPVYPVETSLSENPSRRVREAVTRLNRCAGGGCGGIRAQFRTGPITHGMYQDPSPVLRPVDGVCEFVRVFVRVCAGDAG